MLWGELYRLLYTRNAPRLSVNYLSRLFLTATPSAGKLSSGISLVPCVRYFETSFVLNKICLEVNFKNFIANYHANDQRDYDFVGYDEM
jgi:hypothetical protein